MTQDQCFLAHNAGKKCKGEVLRVLILCLQEVAVVVYKTVMDPGEGPGDPVPVPR